MEREFDLSELGRRADQNVRQAGVIAVVFALTCIGIGLGFLFLSPEGKVGAIPWRDLLGPADLVGGLVALGVLLLSMRPSFTTLRVGESGVGLGDRRGHVSFHAWDDPELRFVITDWRRAPRSRAGLGLRMTAGRSLDRGATLSVDAFETLLRLARFNRLSIQDVADKELATRRIEIRSSG